MSPLYVIAHSKTTDPDSQIIGFAMLAVVLLVFGVAAVLQDFKKKSVAKQAEENKRMWQATQEAQKLQKRIALSEKYGDQNTVEYLMSRQLWVGESENQVIDSLGQPSVRDEKRLKTKRREIWKYYETGQNRFALRITLEDGFVVGWEEKN